MNFTFHDWEGTRRPRNGTTDLAESAPAFRDLLTVTEQHNEAEARRTRSRWEN
jgi:hypothetical protein